MTTINRKVRRLRLPSERIATNAQVLVARVLATKPYTRTIAANSVGYTTTARQAFKRLLAICYNTTDIEGRTINDVFIDESAQRVVTAAVAILQKG